MKSFIVVLSLLTSLFVHAKPAYHEIKSEIRFDVSNLFEGMNQVDYRQYGILDAVAHRYVLISTSRIPYGIEAQAKFQYVPLERNCNLHRGGCQMVGDYTNGVLTFKDSNMGILQELFDGETGKLLAKRFLPMEVTFYRQGHASIMTFVGGENGRKEFPGKSSPFILEEGTILNIGGGFARIKDAKFDLELGRSGSIYKLKDVWLHSDVAQQLIRTSGGIEIKRNGKTIYLSVAEAKATSARLYEKFLSINN